MMLLKKLLPSFLLFTMMAAGCDKQQDAGCGSVGTTAPASEATTLQAYISSAGITAVGDPRGFFYTISRAGDDTHPSLCSTVKVNYTGRLTNGTQFDANSGVSFPLTNVIAGWQEGVPLIGKGGSIILYLPPSLAYGSQAQTGIPANSILVFQIDLADVQ